MIQNGNIEKLVDTTITLSGSIQRYIFKAPNSGFKIARFLDSDQNLITIKGSLPDSSESIPIKIIGQYVVDKVYGKQFMVSSFEKDLASFNRAGIIKFFSGKNFPGIGVKYASLIVDQLGIDCISKIKENPQIIEEVKGIKLPHKKTIIDQIKKMEQHDYQLVKLLELKITEALALKIIERYDADSYDKVKENPYFLMEEFPRIGFVKADGIATALNFSKDDPRRLSALVIYTLEQAKKDGHSYLTIDELKKRTKEFLGKEVNIINIIDELHITKKIRDDDGRIYSNNLFTCEKQVAHALNLINHHLRIFSDNKVSLCLSKLNSSSETKYSDEQKSAIISALTNKVTIITGGPGTGKTTIIKGIVEMAGQVFDIKSSSITLVAPTGRAAKRMTETIGLSAHTIHKTLGFDFASGMFARRADNLLETELVILDESSMVDISLMSSLLDAIPKKALFVIVGDICQLPSVGPGLVLSDIINSNHFQTIKLSNIYRQKDGSEIIDLASSINNNTLDMKQLENFNHDIQVFQLADTKEAVNKIINLVNSFLVTDNLTINDFQILCPIYKGELGVDNLNYLIQKQYIKPNENTPKVVLKPADEDELSFTIYVGDKVIQIENDYETDIMNGDIGIVKEILYDSDNTPTIVINFDEKQVNYSTDQMQKVKLAYAISVHKSQGSEYKKVIFPFTKSFYKMAKKELIYTAVTRAKERLYLVGDMSYLLISYTEKLTVRNSYLSSRIIDDRINK